MGTWNSSLSMMEKAQRFAKKQILAAMGLRQYVSDEMYAPVRSGVDWIFGHEFALPEHLIKRSISSLGDRSRLRRVMHKLTQSRP